MLRFAPRYGQISPSLVQARQVRQLRRSLRAANDNGARMQKLPVKSGVKSGAQARSATARAPMPRSPLFHHSDVNNETLEAALRLFAVHGLSAARRAGEEAEDARVAGDPDKARWWIAVCRTLDRSMARKLQRGA